MKNKIEKLLLNPFEDCRDRTLLGVGVLVFVAMIAVSYFGDVVFDGIIQIHIADSTGVKVLVGNLSNLLILTIGLFALARILYDKVRLIDVLSNVLIARIPILFAGVLTLPMTKLLPVAGLSAEDTTALLLNMDRIKMVWIAIIAVFLLVFVFYFFYLLVVGIKHSINSKKHTHAFLVVIVVLFLDVLATFVYRGYFI